MVYQLRTAFLVLRLWCMKIRRVVLSICSYSAVVIDDLHAERIGASPPISRAVRVAVLAHAAELTMELSPWSSNRNGR